MTKLHPIIDKKNSGHYDKQERSAIEELEDEMTICEMRGFCFGNVQKYTYRLRHKGQATADAEKITHYQNYLNELTKLKFMDGINDSMVVTRAWKLAKIEWRYN